MRTLYLHIGHSKTGSSFLQASFANSIQALADHGFDYPGAPNEAAAGWKISSGNGQALLLAPPESFEVNRDKVFFSAERLFRSFAQEKEWEQRLIAFCSHHDVGAVEVLMFLRDPIPHAESSYQQMVKRGGATESVDKTFENYVQPELVRAALTRQYGDLPIRWHVYNYDRHKTELIELTESFLGLPEGTLVRGDDRPVNRSMTAGELNILRGLNGHDPVAASLLADALCNDVPEVKSETVFPTHAVQKAMLARLAEAIADVDGMIDPAEHYGVALQNPGCEADRYTFSARQVEVLTQTLGRRVGEVTRQMQVERARRQINLAQAMIEKGRLSDAGAMAERAEAALKGLGGEGDIEGLRRVARRMRAAATKADSPPKKPPAKPD